MTMSAPVKFNPVPPAFKEIKKTGVSSELNCSVKAKRSFVFVEPVNIKCLISLKAGVTGLNLTAASNVIHYDPWWNVSAQNQATDRAHRLGQEKTVQVFKLFVKNTIEEKIERLQQRKRDLTEAIVQEGETFITQLSSEELTALFETDDNF